MERLPKTNLNEKKVSTLENVLSGATGGVSEKKADEIFGEGSEKRDEEVARLREGAMAAAETAKIANDTEEIGINFTPEKTMGAPTEKSLKNKILSFFGQAPDQVQSKYLNLGEERMKKNNALKMQYEKYMSSEGEGVAEAYKEAIGKWKYISRNEQGDFVDKTVYSVASGEVNKE